MKKFKKGTYRIALRKTKVEAITEKTGMLTAPEGVEVHEFKTVKEVIEFIYNNKLEISKYYDLDQEYVFEKEPKKDVITRFQIGMQKRLIKDGLKYSKKKGYEVRKKDLSDNDIGEQSDKLSTEVGKLTREQGNKGKGVSKDK